MSNHWLKKSALFSGICLGLLLLLMACGGEQSQKKEPAPAEQAETETPAPVEQAEESAPPTGEMATFASNAELDAKLLLADRVDGAEDKLVARCGGCALAMDGSEAHAMAVGDYKMHFCSDYCQNSFAEKPEEAILAMNIPESP